MVAIGERVERQGEQGGVIAVYCAHEYISLIVFSVNVDCSKLLSCYCCNARKDGCGPISYYLGGEQGVACFACMRVSFLLAKESADDWNKSNRESHGLLGVHRQRCDGCISSTSTSDLPPQSVISDEQLWRRFSKGTGTEAKGKWKNRDQILFSLTFS